MLISFYSSKIFFAPALRRPNTHSINLIAEHLVPVIPTPQRLQEYGVGVFATIPTKSALKKALKKNRVTVNGQPATSATYIRGGERITLIMPRVEIARKSLNFKIKVIFEDEYLAVVYKPAGILVSGNTFKTIANALPQNLTPSTSPDAAKPQPVHRLDYATTGALLTGKTSDSIRQLNALFAAKKIAKTYYAVVIGEMNGQGVCTDEIDGKPAISAYEVVATEPSKRFGTLSLLKLTPATGRRHQLRKHMAINGHPILGDKQYGKEGLILNGKGMYLHAYSLKFEHPFTGEEVQFIADFPERFRKIFPMVSDLRSF